MRAPVKFTFQHVGPLGITLHEIRGGTRIAIESVLHNSQAEKLGVPVGGLLMAVNGRSATGLRLAAVGKLLAGASRPCTMLVLQPDAAFEGGGKTA